jgi:hypothetical protein
MSIYSELDSLEIKQLKKKIADLEIELAKAQSILKENDLLEKASQVSECEAICANEIHKLRIASDNGILTLEDVKVLDILHKNLLLAQGRPVEDKKDNKKGKKSVAELLSIVEKR